MGITDFKKHIKESTKMTKEYKTYLAVMRDEGSDIAGFAELEGMAYHARSIRERIK